MHLSSVHWLVLIFKKINLTIYLFLSINLFFHYFFTLPNSSKNIENTMQKLMKIYGLYICTSI